MCERDINRLPLACLLLVIWTATQACSLTGNQTGDLSGCRLTLNPLSHTSQGDLDLLKDKDKECDFKVQ